MRRTILVLCTVAILAAVNASIVKKERTIESGQKVLLRLAPVDPRSLMQGDYMVLRYAIAREAESGDLPSTGKLVLSVNARNVASFVRYYDGEQLATNECLLVYRNRGGLRLGAESFFFQEDDAELYNNARYGELAVDKAGNSVLVGLCDEKFSPLGRKQE